MLKFSMCLIILFLSLSLQAKQVVTLGTFLIPRYVQSAKVGEFIDLVNELSKHSGYEVNIRVLPPKRTLKAFVEKELDGYFPALDALNHGKVHQTANFYTKEDFIFERAGGSYKKASRKPLACLTRGYPYHKKVLESKEWEITYAASDENCIELLHLKRADLFIGEEITGVAAIANLKLQGKITYNKYTPISKQDVFFAFRHNKLGKELSEKFDKALKKIIISGRYDELFHLKESK
jgi:polar amino acid transport system substrate-binding protein